MRFYEGWSLVPGSEVSEETARGLTAYGRALFSDRVPRVFEMYSRGRLVRVEYWGAVDRLPGVRFAIRIPGPALGDLAWSVLRLYTDRGAPEGFLVQLIGASGRAVMEVSYDVEGILVGTTKIGYEEDGRLRYVLNTTRPELWSTFTTPRPARARPLTRSFPRWRTARSMPAAQPCRRTSGRRRVSLPTRWFAGSWRGLSRWVQAGTTRASRSRRRVRTRRSPSFSRGRSPTRWGPPERAIRTAGSQ